MTQQESKRGGTPRAVVEVTGLPLERVACDLAVAGFFEDDQPLRGAAGLADWRLCGLVSDLVASGRTRGEVGQALLAPSGGRLRAPRLLLIGLGSRGAYRLASVRAATANALRRCTAVGAASVAIVPPGIAGDDFARHAEAVLAGIRDGTEQSALALHLYLVLPATEAGRAARALRQAAETIAADDVQLLTSEAQERPSWAGPTGQRVGGNTNPMSVPPRY